MVGVEVWRSLLFRGGVHYVFGSENGGRGCYILGASRCLLWGGRVSLFWSLSRYVFFVGRGVVTIFDPFFWGGVRWRVITFGTLFYCLQSATDPGL